MAIYNTTIYGYYSHIVANYIWSCLYIYNMYSNTDAPLLLLISQFFLSFAWTLLFDTAAPILLNDIATDVTGNAN